MQNTIAGPGTHEVAMDPGPFIQKEIDASMDPSVALERLMIQKQALEVQNRQMEIEHKRMAEELKEAKEFASQFEPYQDILNDTRSYLPVYLRNRVVFKKLLVKLRQIYGKLADVNSESDSGRKLAHRTVDHAMEIILENALIKWHEIKPQLEGEDYAARQ